MIEVALIKKGILLEIDIISDMSFISEQGFKTQIHSTIGENNAYEFINKGDRKIEIKVYFEDQNEYNSVVSFFEDGKPFLLKAPFFPLELLNLDGGISSEPYYKGFGIATLRFTTAKNINYDSSGSYFLGLNSETSASKKSFLDKMRGFAETALNFVGNTNQAIGSVTNKIAEYADAITSITQGLASSSSIVTNPINSVKASAYQVLGGVNSLITSIYSAIDAVKSIPSDINDFINAVMATGDSLNGLFDMGNESDSAKYNTDFLLTIGDSLADIPINNSVDTISLDEDGYKNVEFTLNIKNDNLSVVSTLILCSILINIYTNIESFNKLGRQDLDNLMTKTEKIYNRIISNGINNELLLQLDLLRVQFFKLFKKLSNDTSDTFIYKVVEPEFLVDIVYAVNGNLNSYEETKKLNNIIGDIVFDSVEVIVD